LAGNLAAGPIRVSDLPADSRAIIHIDVEHLVHSDLGQAILEKNADDLGDLDEVEKQLGIDPLSDILDVTVCLLGDNEDDVVVLASVNEALEETLDRLEEYGEDIDLEVRERFGAQWLSFEMDGDRVHAIVDKARHGYRVAFSPEKRLLEIVGKTMGGDQDSIDEREGMDRIRARDGVYLQLMVPDLSALPMDRSDIPRGLLEMVQSVYGEVGEDDGDVFIRGLMRMSDDDDAQRVLQVAQGLVAMVQLAEGIDQGQDEGLEMLIGLLRGVDFERHGDVVEIGIEIDADDAIEMIEQAD